MEAIKTRPKKTVADYMKLPEGTRAELIDGEILISPSPKERHQSPVGNLCVALRLHVDSKNLGRVFVAPFDVYLPSGNIVQPDVLFVSRARLDIVRDWIRGVPDLVVEVVSPEGVERDRIVKRDLYARNGVTEYWIVDPESRSAEVLRLSGDRYEPAGYFEENDSLSSSTFPGFAIQIRDVFK